MNRFYREKRNETKVAIIGGGLSLSGVDLDEMRRDTFIICVNDAWRDFRGCHAVFSIDGSEMNKRFHDCPHDVFIASPYHCHVNEVLPYNHFLRMENPGLSEERYSINSGENSGYGALNFAYHFRPQHIFMFGIDLVDMGNYWHFHSDIRPQKKYINETVPAKFNLAMRQIKERGIKVYNCSPISAITCFEKITPEEGIKMWNGLELNV